MIESDALDFDHILLHQVSHPSGRAHAVVFMPSQGMLMDHLPWRYEEALRACSPRRRPMKTFSWF